MSDLAENAVATTSEVDSKVEVADGAESAPAAAETGKTGKPPHDPDLQARFDTLTREKYEGFSRADRAEYRAQLAEQKAAELEARLTAKTETVAPSDEFPTLESVGWDEEKHRQAIDAYYTRKADERAEAAISKREQQRQREQAERDWEKRQSDFIKSKPEYAEKVGSIPAGLMPDSLAKIIKGSEMGPEVALHLAENMERLAALVRLPPESQAREIGRIEARLEAAKAAPPPVSKAPPPAPKVEATESVIERSPDDMVNTTPAQFAKWRKKYAK